MDKETLSHYGWIVVLVMILAVLLAFATPFGTFIADGFKATYAGFDMVGTSAMDVVMNSTGGCTHNNTEIKNVTDDYTGDTVCDKCGTVLEEGKHIIPEGGQYTTADGTIYGPGEEMPKVQTGDEYSYNDYIYKYNQYYATYNGWPTDEEQNGWGVKAKSDRKVKYGPILESINGKPITNLNYTFYFSESMTESPIIPSTVKDMSHTYYYCRALVNTPVIPEGVIEMYGTFYGCGNITETPNIPNTVTTINRVLLYCKGITVAPDIKNCANLKDMECAFCDTSIKTYVGSTDQDGDFSNYIIPYGVEDIGGTFWNTFLIKSPIIPTTVKYMPSTFWGTPITREGMPVLPEGLLSLQNTFKNCKQITNLDNYIIPSTVTDINHAFQGCTGLTDISGLEIKCGVAWLTGTFEGCTSLKSIAGFKLPEGARFIYLKQTFMNCTSLEDFDGFEFTTNTKELQETFKGCTSLKETPDFSNCINITDLSKTFEGCTSLQKANAFVTLSSSSVRLNETFSGCTLLTDVSDFIITKNVESVSGLFKGCTSLTGTVTINANLRDYGQNEKYYQDCFAGVDFASQNITITGSSSYIDIIGETGSNYCGECNGTCRNSH